MKYTYNKHYFEKINTEDKAYFLGLLYADGQINIDGRYLRLSLNETDKSILEDFLTCLNSDYNLHFIDKQSKNLNHSNQYYVQVNGLKICKDLEKLGCGQNKTNLLLFPNKGTIPNNLIRHFIRGYFDGDGSVWEGKRTLRECKDIKHKNGKRIRIVHNVKFNITGTIDIIEKIQNILINELGFKKVKINTSKKIENCVQLEYSGRKQLKKFYDFLYDNSNYFIKRKKSKFESCFNII